jgi:hypothetical protein
MNSKKTVLCDAPTAQKKAELFLSNLPIQKHQSNV